LTIFAFLVILSTFILVATIFLGTWRVPFVQIEVLGISNSAIHWIGWIGTLYIAFTTPFYPIIKRKYPLFVNKILNIHVLGNLFGVLLVSIHFAHQVTRPTTNYPDLGTGIVLYATMLLLLSTGFLITSAIGRKFSKQISWLHPACAITFYIVIVMHIIQDAILMPPFT
jgi:hypothetical protein